jgi:putative ABC transport system permease protein
VSARRDLAEAARLAWLDYRHEWRTSLCLVFALAAVLVPLLVLFGLKFGVIAVMSDRLRRDPRNLELAPVGSGRFEMGWIADFASAPEVGFMIARTRAIAATVDLGGPRGIVTAEVVPTASGDPLLGAFPPPPAGGAVLSAGAARRLGAAAGTTVTAWVRRRVDGREEAAKASLNIVGILPDSAFARDAAFVPLDLVVAVEDYRDGRAVPALGWPGGEGPPRSVFAGFRLYARDLDAVAILRERLAAIGVEASDRSAEIETVRALDRNLSLVFWLIAGLGIGGFVLSMGVSLWSSVERKTRELSILRVLGLGGGAMIGFPLFQAIYTGLFGNAVAFAVYAAAAGLVNRQFASSLTAGEAACRLESAHAAAAIAVTLAVTLLASALAGARALRIDPSEGLRDV